MGLFTATAQVTRQQDALVEACGLRGASGLRKPIGALGVPAFAPATGLGWFALVVGAIAGLPWLAWVGVLIVALADWAADLGHSRLTALLDGNGVTPTLRAALRDMVLMIALAVAAVPVPVLLMTGVAVLAVQIGWASARTSANMLARRQPPLRFIPGGAEQPPVTMQHARAYASGVGNHEPSLLLELAALATAALVPGTAAPVLLGGLALVALGWGAWCIVSAREVGRKSDERAGAVVAELAELGPTVMLYSSVGAAADNFIVKQWLPAFAHLRQPWFVVIREGRQLPSMPATAAPVYFAPVTRHVEALCGESVRVVFYLANAGKNVHILREAAVRHVFLNHGDSDKSTSANPVVKGYDEVWVAGRAGIDRYQAAGIRLPEERFRIIGRPQIVSLPAGPLDSAPFTLLYAPTFEGYYEESNYSSLERMGPAMIRRILDEYPQIRIMFKPHPASGAQRPGMRVARDEIVALLRQRADRGHIVVDDDPSLDLQECFRRSHALLSDISSVVTDYLQTERPIIASNPRRLPMHQYLNTFPTQRGSYILERDLSNLTAVMDDVLGSDSLRERRLAMKTYVLGDLPHGPLAAFVDETDAVVIRAREAAAMIQNEFRIVDAPGGRPDAADEIA